MKIYYVGIVERSSDGFYIHFPDLPGCIAAGDTMQEAAAMAETMLALFLQDMADDGVAAPKPTPADAIERDPEVDEVARLLIGVPVEEKAVRVNIMMPPRLLAAIDAASGNRSRFISDATRAKLQEMGAAGAGAS